MLPGALAPQTGEFPALSLIVRAVLTATLSTSLLTTGAHASEDAGRPGGPGLVASAVARLRSDADNPVRVHEDRSGLVDFVGTPSGHGVPARTTAASPVGIARNHLDRYAAMFGGKASSFVATSTRRSPTGGSVVRFRQQVDGLPVFGGEVVLTQAPDGALTSMLGHTSGASGAPAATASVDLARRNAVTVTAKAHQLPSTGLQVSGGAQWLYDASVLGQQSRGASRVYRFEVGNGSSVRELVLVDAATARVLLHSNQVAEALDRQVCDGQNQVNAASVCAYAAPTARSETAPASAIPDVNQAFDLTGATAEMYAEIGGLDLTTLIGLGGGSYPKRLASTVRYCDIPGNDPTCPMQNAFWSGTQMFFGDGYAGADDVVGHEMTHGVIDKFSQLFYFHQSGAINESIADVMGEILDHRNLTAADASDDWQLGEDIPGGALRSLADPTEFGQPDKMTSPLYDPDDSLADNGGVHTNSGIGNKTAYLISQGGTFNGVTVPGIDAADPTLTKTATLYLETIQRLTSGSEYDDLARVLQQSCADLAAASTAGFTATDCSSVAAATQATELTRSPTVHGAARPADAPSTCPAGTTKQVLFADPENGNGFFANSLWLRAPNPSAGVPSNATSGVGSWFAFDPDPGNFGDPDASSLGLTDAIPIPAGQKTYLRFNQWRLFEWTPGTTPSYADGGFVKLYVDPGTPTGVVQDSANLPWENGPQQPVSLGRTVPQTGFGGDSRGWTGSRVDLSGFAKHSVRPIWWVIGDHSGSSLGWFLDDIEIYSCPGIAPPVPTLVGASGAVGTATVRWSPPAASGAVVTGYQVTLAGRAPVVVAATVRSHTFTGLSSSSRPSISVRALGTSGVQGPPAVALVKGVALTIRASPIRLTATRRLTLTGRLADASTKAPLAARRLVLQLRKPGSTSFSTLKTLSSRSDGSYAYTFTTRRGTTYRATYAGGPGLMGVISKTVKVG